MIGFYFENENYHPSPLEKDRTVTRLCLVDEAKNRITNKTLARAIKMNKKIH